LFPTQVDNGGLSALVTSPAGPRRLVMCCDCNYGPFGHQLEDEPRLWLACDLLHQQDGHHPLSHTVTAST
jgi:hypothetical protein